jgi:hypothetical protein
LVQIHLIDAIFYLAGFTVPIYFIFKSRSKKIEGDILVKIMMLFASFMLIQFIYHIAGMLNLKLLSKGILEPVSAVALTIFAIIYYFSLKKMKRKEEEASI